MEPITRKDHNMVYRGPSHEIGDLSCRRVEPGVIASNWKPSAEELEILNVGGSVRVTQWAEPIPPLAVAVDNTADDLEVLTDLICPLCKWERSKPAPISDAQGQALRICNGCGKLFRENTAKPVVAGDGEGAT